MAPGLRRDSKRYLVIASFLRTSFRHLVRNRTYTGLNVLGLSVGLACFAMIGMWVEQQLSYDRMHEKGSRIYRVDATVSDETGTFSHAITPAPLASALMSDLPGIDRALRMVCQLTESKNSENSSVPSCRNSFYLKNKIIEWLNQLS